MAESMGRHMQLPATFAAQPADPGAGRGRRRRRLSAFIVVASFFQGEETLLLASLFSFGILLAFTLTQASIIWLRITEPDMPGSFMMHGNVRIAGRLIPLTSVAGLVLSFSAWIIAFGTHAGARIVGPLWMLAGLCLYATVRIRAGIPLLARIELAEPPPATVTDMPHGAGRRAAGAARRDRRGDDGHRISAGSSTRASWWSV